MRGIGPWPIHRLQQHAAHLRALGTEETIFIADDVDRAAEILGQVRPGEAGDRDRIVRIRELIQREMKTTKQREMPWLSEETRDEK